MPHLPDILFVVSYTINLRLTQDSSYRNFSRRHKTLHSAKESFVKHYLLKVNSFLKRIQILGKIVTKDLRKI